MSVRSLLSGFGVLALLCAGPAVSHHASIEFDLDAVGPREGVIREFIWANPHIRILMDTQDDAGETITLDIEGNSPTTLRTFGVSGDSLKPGDKVILPTPDIFLEPGTPVQEAPMDAMSNPNMPNSEIPSSLSEEE